eukprot:CAMPEP_0170582962 /NCGR_PEP_ID=MMETSP0224-20130122/7869_1 /TAXON_ID=285029 /ORGANISM="Togula jolla, Strain CCCM 725" /LENGTH=462 /DNA_ID=CAMNT_0010906233 /DNA_START=38 /DNA_END=1426 /DNA_ORIENTATION=-
MATTSPVVDAPRPAVSISKNSSEGMHVFRQLDRMAAELRRERELRESTIESARRSRRDCQDLLQQLREAQSRAASVAHTNGNEQATAALEVAKLRLQIQAANDAEAEAMPEKATAAPEVAKLRLQFQAANDAEAEATPEKVVPQREEAQVACDPETYRDPTGDGAVSPAEVGEPEEPLADIWEVSTETPGHDGSSARERRNEAEEFAARRRASREANIANQQIEAQQLGSSGRSFLMAPRPFPLTDAMPPLQRKADWDARQGARAPVRALRGNCGAPTEQKIAAGDAPPQAPVDRDRKAAKMREPEKSHMAASEEGAIEWMPNTASCAVCDGAFSMLNLRHHCRRCGCNVCGACSPYRVALQAPLRRPRTPLRSLLGTPMRSPGTPQGGALSNLRYQSPRRQAPTSKGSGGVDGMHSARLMMAEAEAHRICTPCYALEQSAQQRGMYERGAAIAITGSAGGA